jgi:uroporphyrinogen-III synthase
LDPLSDLRVVITRAEHQSAGLAAAFERAGALVELLPLLEIVSLADRAPLERAAAEVASFDWVVFTSANAVEAFPPFAGALSHVKTAAVGMATAGALRARGIEPDLIPADSEAAGLVASLAPEVRGRCVLLPQAADARPVLFEGLVAAGAEVTAVVAYDKRLPADAPRRAAALFASGPLGWVTFTSPRTVRHFAALFGNDWEARREGLLAVSIGSVTSAELWRWGVEPAAEASRPGDEEMVAAVARVLGTSLNTSLNISA